MVASVCELLLDVDQNETFETVTVADFFLVCTVAKDSELIAACLRHYTCVFILEHSSIVLLISFRPSLSLTTSLQH